MEAGQVSEVVDKLAEKIGVAAEQLAPIAEETVRQVSIRGIAYAGLGVLGLLVATVLAKMAICVVSKMDDGEVKVIVIAIVLVAICLVLGFSIAGIVSGISQWLAPIPYLLGK